MFLIKKNNKGLNKFTLLEYIIDEIKNVEKSNWISITILRSALYIILDIFKSVR